MKILLSIIIMFLSAQLFSKSPDGKGLACDIETIQNDMQTFDYDKLFFWFEKEKFVDFYIEDINGVINFSVGFESIKEVNNNWVDYSYNKDFIEYSKTFDIGLKSEVYKIRINRKTLEAEINQEINFNRKGKNNVMLNNPKLNYIKKLSGKCKLVKNIKDFDEILEEEKKTINKSYRKNKI